MIIAGTGHRPSKLFKSDFYSLENRIKLKEFAKDIILNYRPRITYIISGMAQGWDWALAEAAVELDIPFDAYIPFLGQESRWPKDTQTAYHELLKKANRVLIVSEGEYTSYKMMIRNEKMVDDCDLVLALWNGTQGGTANCINYANKIKKEIINVWKEYETQ